MKQENEIENKYLSQIRHLLPSQAPLKDFVHHNTLHHFQELPFLNAIETYFQELGIKNIYDLKTYLDWFNQGVISREALTFVLSRDKNKKHYTVDQWVDYTRNQIEIYENQLQWHPKVKTLKGLWKRKLNLDVDAVVYPVLFRWISNYMDQGISELENELWSEGLWADFKTINKQSFVSVLKHPHSKWILEESQSPESALNTLLNELVGDESLGFEYLKEQQLMHPGWSGLVSVVEQNPRHLILPRKVRLVEFIAIELLLEFDFLVSHVKKGTSFKLCDLLDTEFVQLSTGPKPDFSTENIWQLAFEWTYYSTVINQIQTSTLSSSQKENSGSFATYQALFCIDDREGSLRSHLEEISDNSVQTFGIPGFFGIEFYYQGLGMVHASKSCPAPVTPHVLIKEQHPNSHRLNNQNRLKQNDSSQVPINEQNQNASSTRNTSPEKIKNDPILHRNTHKSIHGIMGSIGLGFAAGYRLVKQMVQPQMNHYVASSASFMNPESKLTLLHMGVFENGLQVGFTLEELLVRAENMLRSIDLTQNFASLVYLIGHGASSINNPHYAAYDCGACSGRPGSVNARLMAMVLNLPEIRLGLKQKGIEIPETTRFIGALHDTTRDEIQFYDLHRMPSDRLYEHGKFQDWVENALLYNSAERSLAFTNMNSVFHKSALKNKQGVSKETLKQIHQEVLKRSLRLFETRPEYNHATNALCVIGNRSLTQHVDLDRRAFLQSYNPFSDQDGSILHSIMKAAVPVCGGINLEYYFSKVSPDQMGAGSKLPHNVNGLLGISNGVEGDLRTGLPAQMVEIHDAIRLLMVIQQSPEILEQILNQDSVLKEWFENEWMHLLVIHPISGASYYYSNGSFVNYLIDN